MTKKRQEMPFYTIKSIWLHFFSYGKYLCWGEFVNILSIFLSLYHIQIHLKTLIVTRAWLVYFLFARFNSGAENPLFEMDPTDKEENKKRTHP